MSDKLQPKNNRKHPANGCGTKLHSYVLRSNRIILKFDYLYPNNHTPKEFEEYRTTKIRIVRVVK